MKNDERSDWEKTVDAVEEEVSRCLSHMLVGEFSTRQEPFFLGLIQLFSRRVTTYDTHKISIALRTDGFSILINPDYFLKTLKTTAERTGEIRLQVQMLYLFHPFRMDRFVDELPKINDQLILEHKEKSSSKKSKKSKQKTAEPNLLQWSPQLFFLCCKLDAQQHLTHHKIKPLPTKGSGIQALEDLPPKGSAESYYQYLWPFWSDPKLQSLAQSEYEHAKHWNGETYTEEQTGVQTNTDLDMRFKLLLEDELNRLFLIARETMTIEEQEVLPQEVHEQINQTLEKRGLKPTDPAIFKAAEEEIERVLSQMLIRDPFFAQFLIGTVRQITDQIPTMGVCVTKTHPKLVVNPYFLFNGLKDTAERAGVLKHEALHIMLKHFILINNPKFQSAYLYNIAADLEVNQYIGHPWKLPDGAILLSTFPKLNLPPNETAEVYYNLLLQHVKLVDDGMGGLGDPGQHEGQGHSDHRMWDGSGLQNPTRAEKDAMEMDVERQVKEAKDALSSKQAGKIPGRFLELLDEWIKARMPAVDWKRTLRLFISSNPSTTKKSTYRRRSHRHMSITRRALGETEIPTDVLFKMSRMKLAKEVQDRMTVSWSELPEDLLKEIKESVYLNDPSILKEKNIPWRKTPFRIIFKILTRYRALTQKRLLKDLSWGDVPDGLLRQLQMIRVPLDPDKVPLQMIVILAKQRPDVLPALDWADFDPSLVRELKKRYPHLIQPIWPLIPPDAFAKLQGNRPDLFAMKWKDIPPEILAQNPHFIVGNSRDPFMMVRLFKTSNPGFKKQKNYPRILVIIDTSGSVSDTDIEYLFAEIHSMYSIGAEVHILQADTEPNLYFKYVGNKPIAGRGGTNFDPALNWLNEARYGISTPVVYNGKKTNREVKLTVDGAIYLTDGYASTPSVKAYCKLLWVITPSGSDEYLKNDPNSGMVIKLAPYDKR